VRAASRRIDSSVVVRAPPNGPVVIQQRFPQIEDKAEKLQGVLAALAARSAHLLSKPSGRMACAKLLDDTVPACGSAAFGSAWLNEVAMRRKSDEKSACFTTR
jgi:hypothetical protein